MFQEEQKMKDNSILKKVNDVKNIKILVLSSSVITYNKIY